MINWFLLPLAIMAEVLDAATIDWARESNPLVLWLGPYAYIAKFALCAFLVTIVATIKDRRTTAILLFAITVSLYGAWTNVR